MAQQEQGDNFGYVDQIDARQLSAMAAQLEQTVVRLNEEKEDLARQLLAANTENLLLKEELKREKAQKRKSAQRDRDEKRPRTEEDPEAGGQGGQA
jgi:DNA-directed RNA polymerase specialized sigma54-like protein